jgi:hypothetical protein
VRSIGQHKERRKSNVKRKKAEKEEKAGRDSGKKIQQNGRRANWSYEERMTEKHER